LAELIAVRVAVSGELFEIHHIGQVRGRKSQDGERAAGGRVWGLPEGGDLQGHVGEFVEFYQVVELGAAQALPGDGAVQDGLVDDRPELWWVWPGQHVLTLDPQMDASFDLVWVGMGEADNGAGVGGCLQQSGDELDFEGADDRRPCSIAR
jgi:hypothetical protein